MKTTLAGAAASAAPAPAPEWFDKTNWQRVLALENLPKYEGITLCLNNRRRYAVRNLPDHLNHRLYW